MSRTFLSRTYKACLLLKLRSILLWFVKWLSFGNMTCDLCAGRCKVSPCSSLSSQMAFGIGRRVSAPLLGLNYALYLITACIAGWTLNHNIDAGVSTKHGSYIGRSIMSFYTPLDGVSYYCRPSFFFLFFGVFHFGMNAMIPDHNQQDFKYWKWKTNWNLCVQGMQQRFTFYPLCC